MPEPRPAYYETYWQKNESWSPSSGGPTPIERGLFDQYLGPGKVCLDYGCGDATRYGSGLSRSGVVYRGFDISATAAEVARQAGVLVEPLDAQGATTLAPESCDAAICFEVFEHLLEPDRAAQEIHRVLRPGGVLMASVPNAAFWWTRVEFLCTGFFNPGGSPLTARRTPWRDPHIRFYSRSSFRGFMESAGFRVVEEKAEPFTLRALPYLYRKAGWQGALDRLSAPFAWLGEWLPSLFSARLFLVAAKSQGGASPGL